MPRAQDAQEWPAFAGMTILHQKRSQFPRTILRFRENDEMSVCLNSSGIKPFRLCDHRVLCERFPRSKTNGFSQRLFRCEF